MKAILKALIVKGLVQFGLTTGLKAKPPKYILLNLIAGSLFIVACIFALTSLHQMLLEYYDHPMVNAMFAVGFALISLIIWLVVASKRKQHQSKSPIDAPLRALEQLGDRAQAQAKQLSEKTESAIRRKPGKAILSIALVSMFIGWRSARRK